MGVTARRIVTPTGTETWINREIGNYVKMYAALLVRKSPQEKLEIGGNQNGGNGAVDVEMGEDRDCQEGQRLLQDMNLHNGSVEQNENDVRMKDAEDVRLKKIGQNVDYCLKMNNIKVDRFEGKDGEEYAAQTGKGYREANGVNEKEEREVRSHEEQNGENGIEEKNGNEVLNHKEHNGEIGVKEKEENEVLNHEESGIKEKEGNGVLNHKEQNEE